MYGERGSSLAFMSERLTGRRRDVLFHRRDTHHGNRLVLVSEKGEDPDKHIRDSQKHNADSV